MIPRACKRIAEVDFPIAEVSRHSAREKSIRHGHPSTLHLWWARRPLAACRAMLLALLLPDPCDERCPPEFKEQARGLLPKLVGTIGSDDLALRQAILRFIADFANWDNAAHPVFLEVGRGLVKAAHGGEPPLVVDPFAGGGSIPLEALRLGCDAFASDLNPVACLILKVMLEDIPRHGPELAAEPRREATTLDRVHAAMLLQSGGQANALRALLRAEQERGPDFLRLCNALTALYPRGSEEKRLLDAMLLAVPR
jgi:adenine-specific DNA methylase